MSTASASTSAAESVAVEVCVRVRPALPREIGAAGAFHSCVGIGGADDTLYVTTTDAPVLVSADGVPDPVAAKRAGLRSFPGTFQAVFNSCASTTTIYDARIRRATTAVLSGHNATVFAYGQTGSGKTHTVMGDAAGPGLFALVARDLLAAAAADTSPGLDTGALEVELSSLQIYNENLTDLLRPSPSSSPAGGGTGPDLKVRTASDGGVDVSGLSRHGVESDEAAGLLLSRAMSNRRVASTKLNTVSSRSHCVSTFVVTQRRQPGPGEGASDAVVWRARLHLVDLAGSERVKDSGVSGQDLKDAAGINLSLFNLIRVVKALGEQAGRSKKQKGAGISTQKRSKRQPALVVPYNSSALTSVLRDALGGDSVTTVIATISPAQLHARETLSTLSFAASCTKVKNRVEPVPRTRPWAAAAASVTKHDKAKVPRLPWAGVEPGGARCPGGRITVETSHGPLSALAFGDSARPLALCLHGHPSDAESFMDWGLLPALVHAGFYAVALDMPGRGNSAGKPLKTRSEFNLDQGGACDVVLDVIRALGGGAKATIFGYDWGAGIALSFAHAKPYRRHANSVVAFHPSYNEVIKGELSGCCCPCMLIWCKQDQFHSWAKWKPLAQSLRTALGNRYAEHVFSVTAWGKHGWAGASETGAIEARTVAFLTGVDHRNLPAVAHARAAVTGAATDGRAVIRENNVVMLSRDTGGDAFDANIFTAPDAAKDAVAMLRAACVVRTGPGSLGNMLATHCGGGSSAQKPEVAKLFGHLPELSPATLRDPQRLVDLGLWSRAPSGWASMSQSARYFPGRRVLARLRVSPRPGEIGYLALLTSSSSAAGEVFQSTYTTHRAVIASNQSAAYAADDVVLDVAAHGAGDQSTAVVQVVTTRSALAKLNQPHVMPTPTALHEIQLEDGIRCNYRAPLTKAVMASVAVAVAPFAEQLDFDAPAEECEQVQLAAVCAVRSALDITTFQRNAQNELNGGVGVHSRHRDRARYCGDDAARFAVHGQGHCHTVSSVMAAFLSPLCSALGIDLRYRGGQSLIAEATPGASVANSPELHQWLEFTLRPSCRTYTCDLYAADGTSNDDCETLLAMPIEIAYASHLYPNGALNRFSGHPVTTAAYTAGDFDV